MVELESLTEESDVRLVRDLIGQHVRWTHSVLGQQVLDAWERHRECFVKVMPVEYKRVLEQEAATPEPTPRELRA